MLEVENTAMKVTWTPVIETSKEMRGQRMIQTEQITVIGPIVYKRSTRAYLDSRSLLIGLLA